MNHSSQVNECRFITVVVRNVCEQMLRKSDEYVSPNVQKETCACYMWWIAID